MLLVIQHEEEKQGENANELLMKYESFHNIDIKIVARTHTQKKKNTGNFTDFLLK